MNNPVIIDTDGGSDDTFCIGNMLRLHKLGKCNIIGITTVCGNIKSDECFQTISILVKELFGINDIPIFESQSSAKFNNKCSYFYGKDGHYGKIKEISQKIYISSESSESFLSRKLKEIDNLTIIAIGPLTNLYTCEQVEKGILNKAKEILIMGGAVKVPGNITPDAEYNFYIDEEATKSVLKCKNIVIFPLDITHKLRFDIPKMIEKCSGIKFENFFKHIISKIFSQSVKYNEVNPNDTKLIIHDVVVAIYYIRRNIFKVEQERIVVGNKGNIKINENGNLIKVAYNCIDHKIANDILCEIFSI
jgi:inosine-uridine nucleoside N-ribohydrolase